MRNDELDRAFGPTPEAFSNRIDQTLGALEEEKTVKRFVLRTPILVALLLALLCGIAYAVVMQGQEWYYNNRFTAYQEHEPKTHQAILEHLQTAPEQERQDDPLVNVVVQDVSWVPEERLMTLSLAARPQNEAAIELHPMSNLDPDGSYVGSEHMEEYAEDEEARAEHWLWTEDGFGPVQETMRDPSKDLYLFEADDIRVGPEGNKVRAMGDGSSMDSFVGEDGAVITVLECQLQWMDTAYDDHLLAMEGISDEQKERLLAGNREARAAFEQNLDQEGHLTLSVPYRVTRYVEDDDKALYTGGEERWITLRIKVK